jgi:ketosteroid isomerase-like protein
MYQAQISTGDNMTDQSRLRTLALAAAAFTVIAAAGVVDDQKTVAALDTEYQQAVKNNDAASISRLLSDDFVLILGTGKTISKADLVNEARTSRRQYKHQESTERTVRVWGDTAVVTAKLWAMGTENGKPFEVFIWFSDTYVRTPSGWRYCLGQASIPLPNNTP